MIFNRNNKGTDEIKAIIGFIYKSINFDNLSPYISFAIGDLKKIIPGAIFKLAEDLYVSDDYDPLKVSDTYTLLQHIQKIVAFGAYRMFVPGNDLSHTGNGRKFTAGDNEKTPWGWQLVNDDNNLSDLYFKCIDDLLLFLDTVTIPVVAEGDPEIDLTKDICSLWHTSDLYKDAHALLINTSEEFDNYYVIEGSRRLFLALVPIIKRMEKNIIKSTLSGPLFDKLKSYILNNDVELNADEKDLLEDCKLPLAMLTMSGACKLLSAHIMPDRIVSVFTNAGRESGSESSLNLTLEDRDALSISFKNVAQEELTKLQTAVRKYNAKIAGVDYKPTEMYLPGRMERDRDLMSDEWGEMSKDRMRRGDLFNDGERDKAVSFN